MKYWAFISYSHVDIEAAQRLHRALEHYTLPAPVRHANRLPKRLIPVFRDHEELEASPNLTARLQRALDDSRWLIVLCSESSAQSSYVNAEVEYFVKRHGAERVLCVLLSGEPPAVFPAALRLQPQEPLAADLRPGSPFDVGVLKLIAAMAVVNFTDLRSREAQRRRRRNLVAAAAGSAMALGAALYWDSFIRPHVEHYDKTVRIHGIWQGVDRISDSTAAKRYASYRISRRGRLNPPHRVDHVNGSGQCTPNGMMNVLGHLSGDEWQSRNLRFCSASFEYAQDGSLRVERLLNLFGDPIESLSYTQPDLAQFTVEGFAAANARSGIYYVQFERDDQGRDVGRYFLHSRGQPRPNDDRAFGYRLHYDAAGRELRRSPLDADGKETGPVSVARYDDRGRLVGIRYESPQGEPLLNSEGVAGKEVRHDEAGNIAVVSNLGLDGTPITSRDRWARAEYHYDDRGNWIREAYFDADGQPTWTESSDGAEVAVSSYDERGHRIRIEGRRADGALMAGRSGTAVLVAEYSEAGLLRQITELDEAGRVTHNSSGYAINRFRYDARGNMIEQDFLDPEGHLARTRWGSRVKLKFDGRSNIVEWASFDESDQPFVRPDRGAARVAVQRDERGNVIRTTLLDAHGRAAIGTQGYAIRQSLYDDFGNLAELRHLDATGAAIVNAEGYSVRRSSFDASGNEIERRYFDADGHPVLLAGEGHGWKAEFDARGRPLRRQFLDASGQAVLTADGHSAVRYEYGASGALIAEHYEGDAGSKPRIAKLLIRRDRFDQEVERRYLDAAGHPVPGPKGCAVESIERDPQSDEPKSVCADAARRPH